MKTLYMLSGAPGSGKSYYCNKFRPENTVSPDFWRGYFSDTNDESDQSNNDRVWAAVHTVIKSTDRAELLLDSTMAKRRDRRKMIDFARKAGYTEVVGIHMNTSLEDCLANNAGRERKVPEDVIRRMYKQLEDYPPSIEDGFDRVQILENRRS